MISLNELKHAREQKKAHEPLKQDIINRLSSIVREYKLSPQFMERLWWQPDREELPIDEIAEITKENRTVKEELSHQPFAIVSEHEIKLGRKIHELLERNPYLKFVSSADDIIYCNKLYRLNPEIEQKTLEKVSYRALVLYDLAKEKLSPLSKEIQVLEDRISHLSNPEKSLREFAGRLGFEYSSGQKEYMKNLCEKIRLSRINEKLGTSANSLDEIKAQVMQACSSESSSAKYMHLFGVEAKEWKLAAHFGRLNEIISKKLDELSMQSAGNACEILHAEKKIQQLEDYVGKQIRVIGPKGKPEHGTYDHGGTTDEVPAGAIGTAVEIRDSGNDKSLYARINSGSEIIGKRWNLSLREVELADKYSQSMNIFGLSGNTIDAICANDCKALAESLSDNCAHEARKKLDELRNTASRINDYINYVNEVVQK